MNQPISHLQAWRIFYSAFKNSDAWRALSHTERNRLITADRDSRGERTDKYGRPLKLGFNRVAAILGKHAPGQYEVVNIRGFIVNDK